MKSYSTDEVCRLSGATFRQLDYWQRAGVLVPSIATADGSGSRRRWSFGDAIAAALLYKLSRDAGTKGQGLHAASGGVAEAIALCRATTTPDGEAVLVIARDAAWLASDLRPLSDALNRNEVVRLVAYDRLGGQVRDRATEHLASRRRLDPWGVNGDRKTPVDKA